MDARRIVAVAAIALSITACGRSDDPDSLLATETTTTAEPEATLASSTQEEIRAELLELGKKSLSATFRVRLRKPGGHVTWYQKGENLRLDLEDFGDDGQPRERTYVLNGDAYFSCREPGICEENTIELFNYGTEQEELEALGTLVLSGFQTFGQGPVIGPVTRHADQIADASAVCFTPSLPDIEHLEVCFDEQGVPLSLSFARPGQFGLSFEAVEVEHTVDDSDFTPPYPFEP